MHVRVEIEILYQIAWKIETLDEEKEMEVMFYHDGADNHTTYINTSHMILVLDDETKI